MHDDERALSWSSLSILVDHKRTNMPDGAGDSIQQEMEELMSKHKQYVHRPHIYSHRALLSEVQGTGVH